MPAGDGNGNKSPSPEDFHGFSRSSSIDRSQGIHQEVQTLVNQELDRIRTESSASTPRYTAAGGVGPDKSWSYSDLSVAGVNRLQSTPNSEHNRRLDSLVTVYSQGENGINGGENGSNGGNLEISKDCQCEGEHICELSNDEPFANAGDSAESFQSVDEDRPQSAASTRTVVHVTNKIVPALLRRNMAPPTLLRKNMDAIERCLFVWTNNYSYLNPKTVPLSQLEPLSIEIQGNVTELTNSILYFRSNPAPEVYSQETSDGANNCLTQFNTFRKEMWDSSEGRRIAAPAAASGGAGVTPPPNPGLAVARQRLVDTMPHLKTTVDGIVKNYRALRRQTGVSTQLLKSLEITFKQNMDQQRDCQRHIDEMIKCATMSGDCAAAHTLDGYLQDLINNQKYGKEFLDELHSELGILPGIQDPGVNRVKLKPPVFTGEYSAGNLDFYSFKTQMDQFFDIMGNFTEYEKCMKLKLECVQGPARESIMNFESYCMAMDHLKTVYGKPELLFASKAQEIKSCGSCPDGLIDKRNWVIKIEQRLNSLKTLAKSHKIEDLFESSNILAVLMGALSKEDNVEYHKKLRDEKAKQPDVRQTKKVMIDMMSKFLASLVWKATADIDIVVTSGSKGYYEVTRGTKSGSKSNHKYNAVVRDYPENVLDVLMNVNDDATSESDDQSSVGENVADTADAATVESAAAHVVTTNDRKGKLNKDKDIKKKKASKSNSNAPIMMNKSKIPKEVDCLLCDNRHTSMVYCERFQTCKVKKRFSKLIKAKACYKCLRPDSSFDMDNRESWYEEHKSFCDQTWVCDVGVCKSRRELYTNHILVCSQHVEENMEKEAEFRATLDSNLISPDVRLYFASYHSAASDTEDGDTVATFANATDINKENIVVEPEVKESPVYMLQYIEGKNGEKLLVFYDNGCFGAGMSDRAYAALDTVSVRPGPTTLQVAGGQSVVLPFGDEKFWLELDNEDSSQKRFATFRGLRMQDVSCKFPCWPLAEVWQELSTAYTKSNPEGKPPAVEPEIGGCAVDLMLGIRYSKYYPEKLFSLPSGLGLYKAKLKGYGGMQGVLGGPHDVWNNVMSSANFMGPGAYLTAEFKALRYQNESLWGDLGAFHMDPAIVSKPDMKLESNCFHLSNIPNPLNDDDPNVVSAIFAAGPSKLLKEYQILDELGTELGYRCISCRGCPDCKKGEFIEQVSLSEEAEQHTIEQSLEYDPVEKKVSAFLPFIEDPDKALADNTYIAEKILSSQLKIANKSEETKSDVLKSFQKLADKGYVAPLESLPEDEQKLAKKKGFTIPWRFVNSQSLSTPVRLVFDGSSKTKTGKSLNDVVAKGTNKLANLFHLLIAFRCGSSALSSDVKMAYNSVALKAEHFRYQKFLWVHGLNLLGAVCVWIVKTLIYGIKSSGNQTIQSFTVVADHAEKQEPDLKIGADTLREKAYVDDVFSAYLNDEIRDDAATALVKVLEYGQMSVKSVTRSGHPPDETVSVDGVSVGLVGYEWQSVEDTISLAIKPLFLGKAKRGKLPATITGDLREALAALLTKRILLGKVMGVFDPLGLVCPLTSKLKVDLSAVCQYDADWDDLLPEIILDTWVENLLMIQRMKDLRFQRSVFSSLVDVDHGVELIMSSDASQVLAACCVHARMKMLDGGYVCSLVAAKSKLHKATIPKAELIGCTMSSVLGHLVKRNFGEHVKKVTYVTDSMVALYWIHCDSRPLLTAVRNMVIEVRRFSNPTDWYHVESELNLADVATRPDVIPDLGMESDWQLGKEWMRMNREDMPIRSIDEVTVDTNTRNEAAKEMRLKENRGMIMANFHSKMTERYEYSDYLIDPCKVSWGKLVRKIAICYKVIDIWKKGAAQKIRKRQNGGIDPENSPVNKFEKIAGTVIVDVSNDDIKKAEDYLYKKATAEVKHFNCKEKLKNVGQEKDGVLVHNGRILPSEENELGGAMLDLNALSFAKPILDRYSPLSYSIMKYCHEKLTHHGGSLHTHRKSYEFAYILFGKSLANEIRNNCIYCKRYRARTVEVEFGKVDPDRLKVAPSFTIVQIDLFGPVSARCNFGKHKSELKMWAAVYKCPVTLAVAAYCMTDYSTESFLLTLTRHIDRYGVPLKVKIDSGSQLVKAFKEANLCVADVQNLLNQETGQNIKFKECPVGGHNWNGVAERSIKSIKEVLTTVFKGRKFSPIEFETALSYACNELNSMPLCLGSKYTNLDDLDLITPSRLLLGRNNQRQPGGQLTVREPGKMLESMENIEKSWWDVWSKLRAGDYVPKPNKWHKTTDELKAGDIVLFRRDPGSPLGTCIWRIGRIRTAVMSKDDKVRSAVIEYRIFGEVGLRTTTRAARTVAVIHREAEVDFVGQLAAVDDQMNYHLLGRKYS